MARDSTMPRPRPQPRWRAGRGCARIHGRHPPPDMSDKIFLDSNGLTRDSFALARKIYDSGFRPDVIIGLWRGGTPVAVAVQEFLHYLGVDCYHTAVKTQAYTGIGEHKHPVVENLGVLLDHLRDAERVLVVDDIFDSGDTIAAVKETLKPFVKDLRFATLYYKPARSRWPFKPEFYLKETDAWLVFPHELMGLTPDEVREKDPEVARLLGLG